MAQGKVPLISPSGLGPGLNVRSRLAYPDGPLVAAISPATGPTSGGTAVTITGSRFMARSAAPTVTFDGIAATSVVVVSDTSLTCVTPAFVTGGATDVRVTMGSQAATLYGGFTAYSGTVTSISPPWGTLDGGLSVIITGFNFVAGSTITFGGASAAVTFLDSQHFSVITPNHAVGFVDVVITEPSSASFTVRNGFKFTRLLLSTNIRRQPGVTIHTSLGNSQNTCGFTIDGGNRVPLVGENIEIRDSADSERLLFAGTIQTIDQRYEGLAEQLAWDCQAVDFTWLLNRKRPFGLYVNESASLVVTDLINKNAAGFTTNHVQTNLAKVTLMLDGTEDLVTVLSKIAAAIGGGHWYVDYLQDVHFFHVVPPGLTASVPTAAPVDIPPSSMPLATAYLTVSEGATIPSTYTFTPGYYFLYYTNFYDNGSESALNSISNCVLMSGTKQWNIANLPVGVNPGSLTVVARRLYYTALVPHAFGGSPIENIRPFCQVNDNTTTAFTTWFGTTGASSAAVVPVGPVIAMTPSSAVGVPAGGIQLSDAAAAKVYAGDYSPGIGPYSFLNWFGVVTIRGCFGAWKGADPVFITENSPYLPVPGVFGDGNVVYYILPNPGALSWPEVSIIAARLEASVTRAATVPPVRAFTGHPGGPSSAPSVTLDIRTGATIWDGGAIQAKVACLYRDGSVSFPSPASTTALKPLVQGEGIKGVILSNIPLGPVIGGLDVVARFVYFSLNLLVNPSYSVDFGLGGPPAGYVWPVVFADPNWTKSQTTGVVVITDNTTTTLPALSLTDLYGNGAAQGFDPGALVGLNNLPYENASKEILSSDPIPIWPNPDGPSLEDDDPPDDLDDNNTNILFGEAGQPFTVSTDVSQLRNRIFVIGAGSVTVDTAVAGDTALRFGDVQNFSPAGGSVKVEDQGSGVSLILRYTGVTGVTGQTYLTLAVPLTRDIAQGAVVNNFYQADDLASQSFMAGIEIDVNGAKTDGVHEYTVTDGSLKSVFQLYMRAFAELELFARPIVKIRYATRDPKSKCGQTVHVDRSHPPCQGDFLIQDVVIDQIHDESDSLLPRYTVSASSVRFELNDLLLQIIGQALNTTGGSVSGLVSAAVASVSLMTSNVLTKDIVFSEDQMKVWLSNPAQQSLLIAGIPKTIIQVLGAFYYCNVTGTSTLGVSGTIRYNNLAVGQAAVQLNTLITNDQLGYRFDLTLPNVMAIQSAGVDLIGKGLVLIPDGNVTSGFHTNTGFHVVLTYVLIPTTVD